MKEVITTGITLLLVAAVSACERIQEASGYRGNRHIPAPQIEIAPLALGRGQWKAATAGVVTVAVAAPEAQRIQILGRIEGLREDQIELFTFDSPGGQAGKEFVTHLNLTPDFAGEIWAEAFYPDGVKRQSEIVALAAPTEGEGKEVTLLAAGGSVGTDESARSDKLTGGRIRRSRLIAGESEIRITVNLPAFLLTLWQNGKEVRSYYVGIGLKSFPVPVGERETSAMIFNPSWIAPDGARIRRKTGGGSNQMTESAQRNPMGKIIIPLGGGYMIREAVGGDGIGRAVSRGCITMRREDLFDLAEKIIAARNLPVTTEQLNQTKKSGERLVARLDSSLLVDINYDLQVVEGQVLRLYPDVYERGAFALDSLRSELQGSGVDISKLDDQKLRQMLDRVSAGEQFVISVADIKRGRWNTGSALPLTERLVSADRDVALARARPASFKRQE